MKRFVSASAFALSAAVLPHAHAANDLQLHLEGIVDGFGAVTEVKGYNCSIYNPCNPSDPVSFAGNSFGQVGLGQGFDAELHVDLSTGKALEASWTSKDGRAHYGGTGDASFRVYGSPVLNGDTLTVSALLYGDVTATPYSLDVIYSFGFEAGTFAAGTTTAHADISGAIAAGKLKSVFSTAQFDSCQMPQNYWGSACGGTMTLKFTSVTSVPEAGIGSMMAIGLGSLAVVVQRRRRRVAQLARA